MKPMKLLSLDPGDTTGWVVWDGARPVEMGTAKYPREVWEALSNLIAQVDEVVCEDYRIRPAPLQKGYAHAWNRSTTLRVIGAVEYLSEYEYAKKLTLQGAQDAKLAGYDILGMKYVKGKKGVHVQDALAHGAFYLHRLGYQVRAV